MLLWKRAASASLTLGLLLGGPAFAAGLSDGSTVARNTPKFVNSARVAGKVDPGTVMEVSIWLKPHDQAGLDALAKELYDPTSAKYRHWLTKAEYSARFAPTAEEANKVSQFFAAHNMKVVKVGPDNFFVRASGTASAVSAAFHVTLKNYEVEGKMVRGNSEDPYIEGEAAPLVRAVAGLDTMEYTHPLVSWKSALPSVGAARSNLASAGHSSVLKPKDDFMPTKPKADAAAANLPASDFNSQCFIGGKSQNFTTNGSLPTANYQGLTYTENSGACGYTPQNIYKAYGLEALYKQHLDGTGQTIIILDWCGSPTITSDANAFSAQFGLPALTPANFQIIYTPAPSYCSAPDPEINIDVEWAHAIAPGASIALVVPPSASFQDIDEGTFYAVDYQLGNVFSGSFGAEESEVDPATLETESLVDETGAVLGISMNYSTGDQGDFTGDYPQYYSPSVSSPADSPYATGIGGVSMALTGSGSIAWQAGWGVNENTLAFGGEVYNPAGQGYFAFGSGGGESGFFAKPPFQSTLPGAGRQLPDISWLADPFTGGYIAISDAFAEPELQYTVYGGTSLACPMFSALWAIANQAAGEPLGQAAPYLYYMPSKTITDIVPYSSFRNVKGSVTDSSGVTKFSPLDLAEPVENSPVFLSAIWDYPLYEDTAILLTFGTDSGLTVAPGWDNVTGLGVANPTAFVDYFYVPKK